MLKTLESTNIILSWSGKLEEKRQYNSGRQRQITIPQLPPPMLFLQEASTHTNQILRWTTLHLAINPQQNNSGIPLLIFYELENLP